MSKRGEECKGKKGEVKDGEGNGEELKRLDVNCGGRAGIRGGGAGEKEERKKIRSIKKAMKRKSKSCLYWYNR